MDYREDTGIHALPGTDSPEANPGIVSPGIEGQDESFWEPQGGTD